MKKYTTEQICDKFKEIIYKYSDENLIKIDSGEFFTMYRIDVFENITKLLIFQFKIIYEEGTLDPKYINFYDSEFSEIQIKTNFEDIEFYIQNYYDVDNDYECCNSNAGILMYKNFNTELYNETIINYIEKTIDTSIFKNELFNKRLTTELKTKYDYIINANKFDLI